MKELQSNYDNTRIFQDSDTLYKAEKQNGTYNNNDIYHLYIKQDESWIFVAKITGNDCEEAIKEYLYRPTSDDLELKFY